MKLFVKGKLTIDRQKEIEFLVESSPLFQDALDGYKALYKRNVWKKWSAGMASVIVVLCMFYISLLSPVEARFAERNTRFHSVHLLEAKTNTTAFSAANFESKSSAKGESRSELMTIKNRMIDRFEFPDDGLLDMKEKDSRVEKLQKKYMELGRDIRFVRGYMLLDKDYFKKVNTDVPMLGGVPAEYENKLAQVKTDTTCFRLISKTKEVDQMIGFYADSLFDEAIKKGEELLNDFPHDVNVEFYLGMSYFKKEDYTRALHHLLYAVNTVELVFDEDQDYYVAECYARLGRKQQAIEALDLIIHSDSYYKNRAETRYRMIAR